MISFERESVLCPYSALVRGNVKSVVKQQYVPPAAAPWQSNHIGYSHPRQGVFQKKPKGGVCVLNRCHRYCITAVKLCRGLSLVNKDYVGGRVTGCWDWQHAVYLADRIQPDPLTNTTFSPLSDSEKCCHSNVKCHYNCTAVLSNSVGILICYANDWCLMHNQFSATQMVSWQTNWVLQNSLEWMKIPLYEWVSHERSKCWMGEQD